MMFWLTSPLGRWGVLLLAAIISWFGFIHQHDKKIMSRVVSKIEEKNNANVKKANAARRSVADIPVSRLRDAYARD